jgi:anti-anti-sigma factor
MTDMLLEPQQGTRVIRPANGLVAARVAELRAVLRAVVAEGTRDLTLDFSEITMVDSAGLGLLIAAHNSLKRVGGRLSVIEVSSEILELFRSMRIHQHIQVFGKSSGN